MIVIMESNYNILEEFRNQKVVCIGGGHGQSSVLRGLKRVTSNITAVVTVADNGGSSGALRRDMGIIPPGDIRSCLTALAADEELMTQVLQYRFASTAGVGQHNLGNLLLTALANITGSFDQGIRELAKILAIRGIVVPSTLDDINLAADVEVLEDGKSVTKRIIGESEIADEHGRIVNMWIEPEHVSANPEAIRAILNADLILLGPGSLYTSILPNLMVSGISNAVAASSAKRLYISNLTSQPGETDNMSIEQHADIILDHLPDRKLDGVICNDFYPEELPAYLSWCKIYSAESYAIRLFVDNLVDAKCVWHHDSNKLTDFIIRCWAELKNEPNK